MKIAIGATRIVLVTHTRAYKIARVRPLKTLCKIVIVVMLPRARRQLRKKYDVHLGRALWKYLFAGFYANWAEYSYWHDSKDERCLPVIGNLFSMSCIVQPAAAPVSADMIQESALRMLLCEPELMSCQQYGRLSNRVYLLDYAHWRMTQ